MRLKLIFVNLTVAFIVLSGSLVARAQTPDRIFMHGEQSPRLGRVVNEPLDHLVWKPKSEQSNEYFDAEETSWNKIRGIRFGEQPENYKKATDLLQKGQELDRAVELLREIVEKKEVNRSFFIARAQYLIAEIRYRQASDKEGYQTAVDAYQKAIEGYPDNRGFFTGIQRTFELHRKLDQNQEAMTAADQLIEKNPLGQGVTIGALMKARLFLEQENYQKALSNSQRALNTAKASRHKIQAKRLVAESQLKREQYEQAISTYRELIDQKKSIPEQMRDRILTSAHNGIGQALYHQRYRPNAKDKSVREENVQALKDALLHFLKGVVWFRYQGDQSVERERSLYWVARCFTELSENVSDRERVDKYTMEARRAINTILNRYPNTQFRRKVQRLSNRL